jgi:hypothetical protein
MDEIRLARHFDRHTQTLGVLEVDSSALISKTVSAQIDVANMKRKERVRILKRLRGEQFNKEEEEASMKQWAYRTWHKLGLRLLTEADLGHHKGDHMKQVFKKFDTGGAGTIDAREFVEGLSAYKIRPPSKKHSQYLFELCDESRNGEVQYEDFSRWVRGAQGSISIEGEIDLDKDRAFDKLWEIYMDGVIGMKLKQSDDKNQKPKKTLDARAEDQEKKHHATGSKHKFVAPSSTGGGMPYFWMSQSPGSTFLGFRPSHDRLSIANATPNRDRIDQPLASIRTFRTAEHAALTFRPGESPARESLRSHPKESSPGTAASTSPVRVDQRSPRQSVDESPPTSVTSRLSPRRSRGDEATGGGGMAATSKSSPRSQKSDERSSGGAQTHRGRLQDTAWSETNRSRGLGEFYRPPFDAECGSVLTDFNQAVDNLYGLTPLSFNTAAASVSDAQGHVQLLCAKCALKVAQEGGLSRRQARMGTGARKEAEDIAKLSDKEIREEWRTKHPSAAVAPPASIGRVLLTQDALRASEAKRIDARRLAREQDQTAKFLKSTPYTE